MNTIKGTLLINRLDVAPEQIKGNNVLRRLEINDQCVRAVVVASGVEQIPVGATVWVAPDLTRANKPLNVGGEHFHRIEERDVFAWQEA